MDTVRTQKADNPLLKANPISKLFFLWMVKLCYKGTQETLEVSDLYKTLKRDQSEKLTDTLEKHWNCEVAKFKEKINASPSLIRALTRTFFLKYMLFGLLLFVQLSFFRSLQPFVLARYINLFDKEEDNELYIFGGILVVQSLCMVFFMHHVEFGQASIGMRVRVAVSSLIYRKMLKLNKKSLGSTSAGQVVNLLSNDVNRFDFIMICLHYLWIMPFQIVLLTYLIWLEVGVAALAGVLFIVCLTLPIQGYLAKLTSSLRMQTAVATDYRVKLMNEIISGIQIIKMYAWEKPFEKIVQLARKKEIDIITKASYLRGVYMSCMVFIERASLFLTVVCYSLLGNPITADRVFSIAQYFNVLQFALAIALPMAITFGAETLTSLKRLQTFLLLEEKSQSAVVCVENEDVVFEDVTACWGEGATIKNVNLRIPRGSLCIIVGSVGSGKSSILQILLGELPVTSGSVKIGGELSYASQEPWLFVSTVRNNIRFGKPYDRETYQKVVKVCALEKDFSQFPYGDKTLVGEKGVSLSGGQRARINLARAVYKEADIYLLDDPLSAVDTHVSRHLLEECVLKHLRNKTRILVTHQLQYLKRADHVVVINNGTIQAQGTFDEVMNNAQCDWSNLGLSFEEEKKEEVKNKRDRTESITSHKSEMSDSKGISQQENLEEMSDKNSAPLKIYVKASGNFCSIFSVISLLLLAQAFCNSSDLWVTFWTESETLRNANNTYIKENSNLSNVWYSEFIDTIKNNENTIYLIKTNYFMIVYAIIIIVAIILTLIRSFSFFKMAMNSSKNLHGQIFHSLLRAPMRFFETNPSGRVLNRFSKDMGAIDEFLPRVLMDAIQILLVMTGILVMIAVANYYMIAVMVIIGFFFFKLRGWYLATAKDVKHLEGITKSDVFSHINSSFNGITTIRATKSEGILSKEFDMHQDVHTSAWFLTIAARVCFGLWLDLLSVTFITTVIFGFILLNHFSDINSSFVGLAISQSLILTGMLQYGMRQTAEVVNQLTSVERVMQYANLEDENKNEGKLKEKLEWPTGGEIEFKNLSLRYSETDPPVLKNLDFFIKNGMKVGIVGRTGAGKSSMISALFRLTPIEGSIFIDGVSTKKIPLNVLRKSISIIPQEPVLFSATLRYNLDPFNEHDDYKLWDVLEQVELKEAVNDLNTQVSEGGSNFSVGQRQLLCLARAILRNNKILVLDEATANVDPRTDFLIQKTIRKKFQNCTVLTIAHRLHSIMDSDKVLVMSFGQIIEYDHPHLLLSDSGGIFSKMVAETGSAMAQDLRKAAEDSFANRK